MYENAFPCNDFQNESFKLALFVSTINVSNQQCIAIKYGICKYDLAYFPPVLINDLEQYSLDYFFQWFHARKMSSRQKYCKFSNRHTGYGIRL